jgi:predicted GNAT family acetyltransferase
MIAVEHNPTTRRFSTEVDGLTAVLDYQLADGVMTITHTGVPAAIGGRGIAAELMRAALKIARAADWTVDPACSYAAAYMRRHLDDAEKQHEEDMLDEAIKESFPASDSPSVGGSN